MALKVHIVGHREQKLLPRGEGFPLPLLGILLPIRGAWAHCVSGGNVPSASVTRNNHRNRQASPGFRREPSLLQAGSVPWCPPSLAGCDGSCMWLDTPEGPQPPRGTVREGAHPQRKEPETWNLLDFPPCPGSAVSMLAQVSQCVPGYRDRTYPRAQKAWLWVLLHQQLLDGEWDTSTRIHGSCVWSPGGRRPADLPSGVSSSEPWCPQCLGSIEH